jgi:serine acetyltransferase
MAERVTIGDRSRIFGKIVHSQHNPRLAWDAAEAQEPSAAISNDVFIGFDAIVIGKIAVGTGAYICAGATITRDVPPGHIAYGVNKIVPPSEWPGPLRTSAFRGEIPLTSHGEH